MKVFNIEIILCPKDGFSKNDFEVAMKKAYQEISLEVYSFDYYEGDYNTSPSMPAYNRVMDRCVCKVEVTEYGVDIPYHQIALGTCSLVSQEIYPFFKVWSIKPSYEEINI